MMFFIGNNWMGMLSRSLQTLSLIALLLCSISCNNDSLVTGGQEIPLYEINGAISDWNLGDTVTIVLGEYQFTRNDRTDSIIAFGSGNIDHNGKYSFYLTAPVPELVRPSPVGFMPSDTSVRFAFLERPLLVDQHNKRIGYIYFSDTKEVTTLDFIHREFFLYSTKDVGVTGTDTNYYFQSHSTDIITVITNRDIAVAKGWNKIVTVRRSLVNNIYVYQIYRDNAYRSITQYKYPL